MRGAILGSGTQSVRGGVSGGLGVAVVRLNVCSRMVLSAAKNSSLLKSKQPVRLATPTASAWK